MQTDISPKIKLNYGKTFLLGFGFFGVSVIWGVYNAFVPLFLANKFGLAPALIGFFMTLDNIAALLIQPPVGAWSDRLRTPIGRRMPFILIGAPIGALAFGLIPLASVLPLFVACTSTLLLSMALWRTPVVALMPDITPSRFRSQANGIINFMGGVGAIVSFLVGASLYEINTAYPFWLGSVLVLVSSLLVLLFIREPKVYETGEEQPGMIKSLGEVLRDRERSALRLLLAIFFWFVSYNAVEAFFTLYANKHLGMEEAAGARLLGQLSLLFVLFALPSGYIGGRFGRQHHHHDRHRPDDRRHAADVFPAGRNAGHRRHQVAGAGGGAGGRPDPDAGGHRLGADQHQLAADGGGHDRRRARGHLHRAVLPGLDPGSHRRPEHQRLDRPADGLELRQYHAGGAAVHGGGFRVDGGCEEGRSAGINLVRFALEIGLVRGLFLDVLQAGMVLS